MTSRAVGPALTTEIVHTVMIPRQGRVEYSFDLPLPNATSYVWIGFVRQENINADFSILDRNSNLELYQTKDKGEYLAKLFFYQKERLLFIFENPSIEKVPLTQGSQNADILQVHALSTQHEHRIRPAERLGRVHPAHPEALQQAHQNRLPQRRSGRKAGRITQAEFNARSIRVNAKLINWALVEMLSLVLVSVAQVLVIKNMVIHKKMF